MHTYDVNEAAMNMNSKTLYEKMIRLFSTCDKQNSIFNLFVPFSNAALHLFVFNEQSIKRERIRKVFLMCTVHYSYLVLE